MGSHSNATEAHAFFYKGVNEGLTKEYSGCTLSYEGNRAISYSTCVAIVIPTKGSKKPKTDRPKTGLTLLSSVRMSNTTASHISLLHSASPFDVVEIPFERGCRDVTPQLLADLLYEELSYYSGCLNRKENRTRFIWLLQSRQVILNTACTSWAKPFKDRRFAAFLKIDVTKAAADLQAQHRKEAVQRAAETKALFQQYVKDRTGTDYLEFVRSLCSRGYMSETYPFTSEQRSLLKKKLLAEGKSYVWLNGDQVETSHGVRIPVQEARIAMKAWASGKDMRNERISTYVVLKYEGNEIQIGCHHIPRENMLALYEAVVGKPFPDKKAA